MCQATHTVLEDVLLSTTVMGLFYGPNECMRSIARCNRFSGRVSGATGPKFSLPGSQRVRRSYTTAVPGNRRGRADFNTLLRHREELDVVVVLGGRPDT